jgi:hypothetical protein
MGVAILHKDLAEYISKLQKDFEKIPAERREQLEQLASFIETKIHWAEKVKLVFICTHNSRRSHMAQLWASAAAYHYGIQGIMSYSGGTEATAFNLRAVKAMREAGFQIREIKAGQNPRYQVNFSNALPSLTVFSKKYGEQPNPDQGFAAIMTCSDADGSCPVVTGAEARYSIRYEDPKIFDGTRQETAAYRERCHQIALEMLYTFSQVKKRNS